MPLILRSEQYDSPKSSALCNMSKRDGFQGQQILPSNPALKMEYHLL
jgi:hypothetical protein